MLGSQWSIILGYRRLSVKLLNAKQRLSFLEDVSGQPSISRSRFRCCSRSAIYRRNENSFNIWWLSDPEIGSTVERTSFPTVIILVWDLIVGSLVEISDARRLFPHLTTVYGLPSMFSCPCAFGLLSYDY